MAGMLGDAKRAKKDVLADLVSIKHEYQTCIMDASMRKAVLTESEKDVKEDQHAILQKLHNLLKVINDNARYATSQEVKAETEKINDEIIFLEEQYQSLEEMEEYVKDKTSNTNLKPLKLGKEKCEYTRERLDAYKVGITRKSVKFVLHPMLAQILEQMESFTMGNTLVLPVEDDPDENGDENDVYDADVSIPGTLNREPSIDPIRTTFMRSNSSKMINLPDKKGKSPLSRQISNSSSTAASPRASRQNSKIESRSATETPTKTVEKKSKLITRSKTTAISIKEDNAAEKDKTKERYRSIAGLRATLTDRSVSAPFLNLPSKTNSIFVEKKADETSPIKIKYKEALQTKNHATGCYITGISVLSNGSVVVCDSVHDSLQLYDPERQQISEMECPHPWGIAAVSESAVAVSLHYDHKIILVQAAKTLERINEKDIILKCNASLVFDVKYYAYRIYTLCIEGDVHILDLKGREYGVIKSGMPQNTLKYFDINTESENVIISGEHGVVCLNFKGLPLWYFKTKSKPNLLFTGVLVYKGNLLLCDWENNQLSEIYDDGQKVRTVFSQGLVKPVAMCQSESGGEIFVTQGDYDLEEQKARTVNVLQADIEDK